MQTKLKLQLPRLRPPLGMPRQPLLILRQLQTELKPPRIAQKQPQQKQKLV